MRRQATQALKAALDAQELGNTEIPMNQKPPPSSLTDIESVGVRSTLDLLALSWRRRFVLAVTAIAGLVVGIVYYVQATRIYESTAQVLVVPKRPGAITGEQRYESHFEDYVATHEALIVSPLIVQRAIETANLGSLPSFAGVEGEDLIDMIAESLSVESGPRNLGDNADSIMNLAFYGTEPDDCPVVVQAVLDSYRAFLDETYRGMSDQTKSLISQARDLLKNDLEQQEEEYSQFRQQSPLVTRGTDEVNPLQDRLTAIETQRSELLIRRVEIEKQLAAIDTAREKAKDDPSKLLAMVSNLRQAAASQATTPTITNALDNQLLTLLEREQELLQHYGPNHPHVLTVRQQIAATRNFYVMPTPAEMHGPADSAPSDTNEDSLNTDPTSAYVRYLQQELEQIQNAEELLTQLYEQEHDAAKELSSYQLKDERFRRNMDRTQQLYDGVISQLQQASLIKDYGGFEASVIGPPRVGEKVSPRGSIVGPISLLAGILLGFILALLAEFTDRGLHSREDVQAQLGLPVVGQIPQLEHVRSVETEGAPLDPLLCTYFEARSPQAEAYRELRTAIYFSDHGQQRVIQVVGAGPVDDTSALAANLAVSIAQSNRRTLLIDGDLRRPRQHKLFGLRSVESGLGSIESSVNQLSTIIRDTAVDHLWLLPAGPLPLDPSGIFLSPCFGKILEFSREKYDYVVINTGPLLAVSDASVVASQTDGVLLNLRPTGDSRRRAQKAIEILQTVNASTMGLIISEIGGSGTHRYRHETYSYHDGLESGIAHHEAD